MALTITKLKMWKDPGYTRGCLEVPPVGSKKLPGTPDYSLAADQTLRPHKASTLTSLQLPIDFTSVFGMSYLYIEASDGSGSLALFGWVDSITQMASSAMNTQINWTVDWWRSYSDQITFGTGTITHCPDSTYRRPYGTAPRKWQIKHFEKLAKGLPAPYDTQKWVVNVIYSQTIGGVTIIRTYYWRTNASNAHGESKDIGGVTHYAPGLRYLYNGTLDEVLGLDPASIVGIYITPYVPTTTTGTYYITHDHDGDHWFAYYANNSVSNSVSITYQNTYTTDDNLKAVIVDPTGAVVYTMPWGFSATKCDLGVDIGTVGASVTASLYTTFEANIGLKCACAGMFASFPAIDAPFNSNAYASYCYSGQRDYDRETRNIQRDEQNDNGVIGIISAVPSGNVTGAISGLITTPLNYFTQGTINDRLNDATDKLYSNQASTVIQTAKGDAYTRSSNGAGDWYIVQLEADSVSQAEYTAHIAKNGYSTDISAASCSSFITTGGALQITNMVVTGNAPPEAKQFIKGMFTNGVIIQENNPSGVAP